VSHLPPQDWRIGSTFFLCAIMQTLGILVAWRYFKARRAASIAVSPQSSQQDNIVFRNK
jgi:DHA1 family tetracycline resistance protein-like MFS transporter